EVSINVTVSGAEPTSGAPVNAATGTIALVPVTALVLLPAVADVKTTALLKVATLVGANRITTLVEPNPARLNGLPESTEKGEPGDNTVAIPLLSTAPPRLVTVKLA